MAITVSNIKTLSYIKKALFFIIICDNIKCKGYVAKFSNFGQELNFTILTYENQKLTIVLIP